MNRIDISESFVELNEFLRFNTDSSTTFVVSLKLKDEDKKYNSIKISHLVFLFEILERFNYPMSFVVINKLERLEIEILIPPYSPLNSVNKNPNNLGLLQRLKNSVEIIRYKKLDEQSLIQYIYMYFNSIKNRNFFKDFLIRVLDNFNKINRIDLLSIQKVALEYNQIDFFPNKKTLKVVVVLPIYHSSSAGIRVLHILANKLAQSGIDVCKFEYSPSELDSNGNINFDDKGDLYSDCIAIVPETITALPFKPRKTVRYLLNYVKALPMSSLGEFPVMPDYEFCYSSVISTSIPRLFINVLPRVSFDPNVNNKNVDLLLYFGKAELFENLSSIRYEINKIYGTKYLEIDRQWPSSMLIAPLLASSKNLISYDPVSALNHEASLFGCNVHIIFNKSNLHLLESLRSYELNNSYINLYSDLSKVKLTNTFDLTNITSAKKMLMERAEQIEKDDFSRFVNFLSEMRS